MRAMLVASSHLAGPICLLGLLGCSEYGVSPEPPQVDPIVEEEEPGGGVRSDPIPESVPVGGVQGTICNQPEQGLRGAVVMVEHAWGLAQTSTDEEGYFKLDALPAGRHVLVVRHPGYNTQIVVDVPRNEVATVLSDDCVDDCGVPVPCLGLAEAVDRGAVLIMAGPDGTVEIQNTSPRHSICLQEWAVIKSLGSQDAIVGQDPGLRLEPGDVHVFDYAVDVFGDKGREAWWCVEEQQVIADGVRYAYNGSLAPDMLWDWIHDRTDSNYNNVEDHEDVNFERRIQTQVNVWSTQDWHPIVLVGRTRSLVRLEHADDTAQVVVEASNLGQLPTEADVFEVVPPGFQVVTTEPQAIVTSEQDGSTTLRWTLTLDGAQPVDGDQAIYDVRRLTYTITPGEEPCIGRCEGNGVYAIWRDAWRRAQDASSEPLIIEACPAVAGEDAGEDTTKGESDGGAG